MEVQFQGERFLCVSRVVACLGCVHVEIDRFHRLLGSGLDLVMGREGS